MECKQQVLAETDSYRSSLCETCNCIHIQDGVYMFGFTVPAFQEWGSQILKMEYDQHCKFEGEFNYLTIYSYIHHYEFHFFRDQFEEYQDLIGQTLALLEVYEMMGRYL